MDLGKVMSSRWKDGDPDFRVWNVPYANKHIQRYLEFRMDHFTDCTIRVQLVLIVLHSG